METALPVNAPDDIFRTEVRTLLGRGGQLVDVRTPEEYAAGALPGAVNIPVQDIGRAEHELDRERPVVLYCRSGARTRFAKGALESMGFAEVHDLGSFMNLIQR